MKWKIGNVKIDNQVTLAPMAGICDSAFRRIIKSMGCGLVGCEMVSDKAIVHGSVKTRRMLHMTDYERPIAQQIFGSDVESLKAAAKFICAEMEPDILDINMGCPVPKVCIRSHAGSALLKHPDKVGEIVSEVASSVDIPVTVKIRSGWSEDSVNAVEIAKIIENAGASAIAIHPRTKSQSYGVCSDWSVIGDVKQAVDIPVIGNGDIKTCHDAKAMIDLTDCDAVMIGRGVLGNPWLIKQTIDYLDSGVEPFEVAIDEKMRILNEYSDMVIENCNPKIAMHKMRTHAAYYLKTMPKTVGVKKQIFKTNSKQELFDLLNDYIENGDF